MMIFICKCCGKPRSWLDGGIVHIAELEDYFEV